MPNFNSIFTNGKVLQDGPFSQKPENEKQANFKWVFFFNFLTIFSNSAAENESLPAFVNGYTCDYVLPAKLLLGM